MKSLKIWRDWWINHNKNYQYSTGSKQLRTWSFDFHKSSVDERSSILFLNSQSTEVRCFLSHVWEHISFFTIKTDNLFSESNKLQSIGNDGSCLRDLCDGRNRTIRSFVCITNQQRVFYFETYGSRFDMIDFSTLFWISDRINTWVIHEWVISISQHTKSQMEAIPQAMNS